jgi:hypothetical protein
VDLQPCQGEGRMGDSVRRSAIARPGAYGRSRSVRPAGMCSSTTVA